MNGLHTAKDTKYVYYPPIVKQVFSVYHNYYKWYYGVVVAAPFNAFLDHYEYVNCYMSKEKVSVGGLQCNGGPKGWRNLKGEEKRC